MAAFNFPNSPSVNDLHTENGVTFKWNGSMWNRFGPAYTDTANLNVTGIGTIAGNFHVGGVLTYEDVKNVDSVGIITARTGIHIDDSITHIGDTDTKIRFPGANQITFETGGVQRLELNNYGTYQPATVPLAFLATSGDSPNIKSGGTNANDLLFTAGNTERLRIDSSGKLLIAQTASYNVFAHSKLQISGTDSLAAASFTRWSANAYGPYINLGKSRGGVGAYTVVQDDDHLGTINFAAADGTDIESVGAAISAEVDGTPGGNDIPGRLVFKTTADGAASATERLRITSDGDIVATGNLKTNNIAGRNLVINGDMQIAQRAISFTGSTQGYQTVDRFQIGWGGADSVIEQHQSSLTSSDTGPWEEGFRKEYHIVNGNQSGGAGAGDFCQIIYRPEGQDINRSGWNFTDPNSKVTLSYWIKSDVAQNYYGFIESSGPMRIFGWETGTLTANTWKKVTVTIPGFASLAIPDTNASAFSLAFIPFYGTNYTASNRPVGQWYTAYNYIPDMASTWWTTDNATFQITGVQLEVGSVATPFEHKKFQDELLKCQRYYQQIGAIGQDGDFVISASHLTSNGDQTRCGYFGPTNFRATPTITEFGNGLKVRGSGSDVSVTAIGDIDVTFPSTMLIFNCECSDIGDNNEIVVITNQANSGIKINAEL